MLKKKFQDPEFSKSKAFIGEGSRINVKNGSRITEAIHN